MGTSRVSVSGSLSAFRPATYHRSPWRRASRTMSRPSWKTTTEKCGSAQGRSLFFGETLDADKITRIFGGKEKLEARKPQGLTPRELEVLQLMTSGYSNGQIAAALEISLNTVDSYKERIKGKFGLDSMVECVAHAVAKGIVTV